MKTRFIAIIMVVVVVGVASMISQTSEDRHVKSVFRHLPICMYCCVSRLNRGQYVKLRRSTLTSREIPGMGLTCVD